MNPRNTLIVASLVGAVGTGILGGIFYGFSSFIMAALGRLAPERATDAMNAINVTVITPSFLGWFMGLALFGAVVAVGALFAWHEPSAKLAFAASLVYIVGTFGVTMFLNVPLNDQLAAVDPAQIPTLWPRYLDAWTTWNTIRTVCAVISSALFMLALVFAPAA
jgi:uncharacterized membrane protein